MSDGMPDDWKDVVKKITDDWSDNLEDLMVKHSEAEFLKHAASTGVNFNLIQTEALKKLVLEDVGFVAQTNKKIGQSIIDDIEKLLITKGDWASAKDAVLEHVDNVFSGQEKIVIDNIGKQAKRAVLDAELGHVILKDFTVKRKWTGNVDAYSDMVAKSLSQKARTMGDLEGYRTTTGIVGWRRMSSLGGKTCELCASLHGRAYYFAGEGVDVLPSDDGLMFEPHPNGFCYQAPIYEEWTGLKNLNEIQLDDHLARWKIDTKSPIKNLKRVPDDYGRLSKTDVVVLVDDIREAFALKIRDEPLEHTYVFNDKGDVVLYKSGTEVDIEFTSAEVAKMKGMRLVHNHPGDEELQPFDIRFAVAADLEEMSAATADKIYIANNLRHLDDPEAVYDKYREIKSNIFDEVLEGLITRKQAKTEIWRRLSKDLKFNYIEKDYTRV